MNSIQSSLYWYLIYVFLCEKYFPIIILLGFIKFICLEEICAIWVFVGMFFIDHLP